MAAGEHTVAAAAKNCIAMAPTSWRSIEGGSSARLDCIRCFCALSARGFISSWHAEIPRNIDARMAFYSSKRNSAFYVVLRESREVLLQFKVGFIEQYLKVISGILFAALALGFGNEYFKKSTWAVLYLSERVMSVHAGSLD